MPSELKTPNIGLNLWQGNEYPKRQDFVDDNNKIDEEFGTLSSQMAELTLLGAGGIFTQSSGQSVPNNTVFTILFAPSTNPITECIGSQIEIKKSGVYLINFLAYVAATLADNTNLLVQIDRNFAHLASIRQKHAPRVGESWSIYQCVYVGYLNANDIIEAKISQNSNGAVNSQYSKISFAWLGNGGI